MADNLITAAANLRTAVENLRTAARDLRAAAENFRSTAENQLLLGFEFSFGFDSTTIKMQFIFALQ